MEDDDVSWGDPGEPNEATIDFITGPGPGGKPWIWRRLTKDDGPAMEVSKDGGKTWEPAEHP